MREGQTLPLTAPRLPDSSEREKSADNVLRFYESRPDLNGNFTVGQYCSRQVLDRSPTVRRKGVRRHQVNSAGQDFSLDGATRSRSALKKNLALKPCEQLADYDPAAGGRSVSQLLDEHRLKEHAMIVSEPRAVATGSCDTLENVRCSTQLRLDPVATARGSDTAWCRRNSYGLY